MTRSLLLLAFSLTASAFCSAQQSCSPAAQKAAAESVAAIRVQLRQVHGSDDEMNTDVPAAVAHSLPQFRAALRKAAETVVVCGERAQSPGNIETTLAGMLHANAPQPGPGTAVSKDDPRFQEALSSAYGSNLLVHAALLAPGLLSVKFTYNIECGKDNVLLLFEQTAGRWQERLVWQAQPYQQVSGAFGDMFLTALLPATAATPFRLVAAHGHPWCTSRFSGFVVDVLEPTRDPARPRVVWQTSRGYSRGDFETRLKASGDTFELRTHVPAWDPADYERLAIYRYRVTGDLVTRIEPIAANGQGFVDEWLDSPWPEAASQSASEHLAALRAIHTSLTEAARPDAMEYLSKSNGALRACADKASFQVEIDTSREITVPGKPGGRSIPLPPTYFLIREANGGYQMADAKQTPDPRCAGPDLLRKRP